MPTAALAEMAEHQFVALTTFRRDGTPVATPIWVAPSGDALVFTTGADSGKIKRLRRDPRVELRPCTRTGTVAADAPVLAGRAEVTPPDGAALAALRAKYGVQFRILLGVERLLRRGRDRVIVRVTEA